MVIDYLRELETHVNSIKELTRECDAQNIDIEMLRNKVAALEQAIVEASIPDGSITSAKLASDAVTTAKLATGSVTAAKIATGAVTNARLAANAVTEVKIANGAVTNNKLSLASNIWFSSDIIVPLTSGTTWQAIAPGFTIPSGVYIGFLWVRKGLTSGVTGTHLLGTRIYQNSLSAVAAAPAEIRVPVTAAAVAAQNTFIFRSTGDPADFVLQAFQSSGIENTGMQFVFQTIKIA